MRKTIITISCFAVMATAMSQTVPVPSMKAEIHPYATTDDEGTLEVKLYEDFSLLTEGAEGAPSEETIEDENLSIPASLTHTPGWMGYYLRQAGGMLYIDLSANGMESGVVNTPKIDLSGAAGAFTVSFRAKSAIAGGEDKIYIDSKRSLTDYATTEVKVTDQWKEYSVKFENGGTQSYLMFSPWLDPVYVDDIKVEVLIPYVAAPTSLTFSNYTVTGFTAAWAPVDGATSYLLNVYTKDADGLRTYAIQDLALDATSYEVKDLPQSESFYYFSLKATDGVHTSPESVEVAVEGLLLPELEAETNLSERGFTANWKPVDHARSYNFIATREHTASEAGLYYLLKQDFSDVIAATSYYDYTSIPQLPGWTIASPTFKDGEVGVISGNGQYGDDAWIQSSIYDLSNAGGDVNLKMNVYCDHKKYTSDIYVGLFTYDESIGRYRMVERRLIEAVGKEGAVVDLDLKGGGEKSLFQIEPDGYATMMITSLEISQELAAGDRLNATVASLSTTEPTVTLSNLDILPGDKVYYVVRAVGRNSGDTGNIYSDYTAPKYVDLPTSGICLTGVDAETADSYTVCNLQGVVMMTDATADEVLTLPAGLYIINGEKRVIVK